MEQKLNDKGRESKGKADGQTKKVVATRTVDKLLEQSRLSAPGSVRNHGPEKKEPEDKASSSSKAVGHNKEKRPVRQKGSRNKGKNAAKEIGSNGEAAAKEGGDNREAVAKEDGSGKGTVAKKGGNNRGVVAKEGDNGRGTVAKEIGNGREVVAKEGSKDEVAAVREGENNGQGETLGREQKGNSKGEMVAEERKKRRREKGTARLNKLGSVGRWFQVLCFMHIPVFGFLYMLVKALRRKTPQEERHFAIAYLLYRILILFLAFTILYILYKVGLQFVDGILDYAGMGT